VAGRDGAAMAETVRRYSANPLQHWAQDQATLEDVFIDLMTRKRVDQ
jgi:ABC-2 type transport system ATP-binding protein